MQGKVGRIRSQSKRSVKESERCEDVSARPREGVISLSRRSSMSMRTHVGEVGIINVRGQLEEINTGGFNAEGQLFARDSLLSGVLRETSSENGEPANDSQTIQRYLDCKERRSSGVPCRSWIN